MVTIRIVIEGGVLPNDSTDAQTFNNSEKLRESFYKLLTQIISPEIFNLEIEMGAGEKNACLMFKKHIKKNSCSLLIDLDGSIDKKAERLLNLEIDEYSDFVFFMIQEMEAWILSQPNAIEKGMSLFNREKPEQSITDDPIFNQNPIDIVHPSKKLNTILSRYFSFTKRDEKKKKKYGKLKDSPLFIKNLDITQLTDTFEDAKRLVDFLNQKSINNTA